MTSLSANRQEGADVSLASIKVVHLACIGWRTLVEVVQRPSSIGLIVKLVLSEVT